MLAIGIKKKFWNLGIGTAMFTEVARIPNAYHMPDGSVREDVWMIRPF